MPADKRSPNGASEEPEKAPDAPARRLLVADDHPFMREGIRAMLSGEGDLEVVAEAADGQEALELCRELGPDLALMDVRMPRLDGLAATRAIKREMPSTGVLVVTTYEDPDYLFEAVKAGAGGYVLKNATRQEFLSAVRRTLAGESTLDQALAARLLRRLAGQEAPPSKQAPPEHRERAPEPAAEALTPRELEVLRALAQGKTNPQISREQHFSEGSVKLHVRRIIAKLGVSDRTQAAVKAIELGLISPEGR